MTDTNKALTDVLGTLDEELGKLKHHEEIRFWPHNGLWGAQFISRNGQEVGCKIHNAKTPLDALRQAIKYADRLGIRATLSPNAVTDKNEALLPCPFCGGEFTEKFDVRSSSIQACGCENADCIAFNIGFYLTCDVVAKEELQLKWNTRALTPSSDVGSDAESENG
jgi:hypothetical protein